MHTINDLIVFMKENHPGFAGWPVGHLRIFFDKYRETTFVDEEAGEICGVAIYQQWPVQAHFVCIVSIRQSAFEWMREIVRSLNQKITWFDEDKMRLVELCP